MPSARGLRFGKVSAAFDLLPRTISRMAVLRAGSVVAEHEL
jgi:hypothetical protein